jgi:hypothetical protein
VAITDSGERRRVISSHTKDKKGKTLQERARQEEGLLKTKWKVGGDKKHQEIKAFRHGA